MVRHLQPTSQVMVVTGSLSSGRRDELVYPPIEQLIQNQLLSPRRTLKITDRKREICSLKFGTQLAHRTAESLAKPRIPTDSQSVNLSSRPIAVVVAYRPVSGLPTNRELNRVPR